MSDPEPPSSPAAPAGAGIQTVDAPRGDSASWVDRLREAFGLKTPTSLRRDLEEALSREETIDPVFLPEERAMLRNILRLRETQADDLMVPRPDILAIEAKCTLREVILRFLESGHSRMPVYRDTLDEPVGMVHIKDVMTHVARLALERERAAALDLARVNLDTPLLETDLVREVLFVPASMPAIDLLARMQATRIQIALVIDEFGGTDGLVSLEDVVEAIVGDIEDEHDDVERPMITAAADDVFIADARTPLEDVASAINPGFGSLEDDDVETLGGLVLSLVGRIPARGDVIAAPVPGYDIEVLDADQRQIKRLRIIGPRAVRPASGRRRRTVGETSEPPPGVTGRS